MSIQPTTSSNSVYLTPDNYTNAKAWQTSESGGLRTGHYTDDNVSATLVDGGEVTITSRAVTTDPLTGKGMTETYIVDQNSQVFYLTAAGERKLMGNLSKDFTLEVNGTTFKFDLNDAGTAIQAVGVFSHDDDGAVFGSLTSERGMTVDSYHSMGGGTTVDNMFADGTKIEERNNASDGTVRYGLTVLNDGILQVMNQPSITVAEMGVTTGTSPAAVVGQANANTTLQAVADAVGPDGAAQLAATGVNLATTTIGSILGNDEDLSGLSWSAILWKVLGKLAGEQTTKLKNDAIALSGTLKEEKAGTLAADAKTSEEIKVDLQQGGTNFGLTTAMLKTVDETAKASHRIVSA